MSGPIVRTGATPEYSKNWDSIFGKKDAPIKARAEKTSTTDAAKHEEKSSAGKKKGK